MNRGLFSCFRLLMFLACASPLLAQQPQTAASPPSALTLEECIRLAGAAPSAVRVAQLERRISEREVSRAQAAFLPRAEGALGFTYNSPLDNPQGALSFVALNGVREYVMLVGAAGELDTSGRLRADLDRARAAQDAAAAGQKISERDLKRSVQAAYYRLLLLRHVAQAIRESLAGAEDFEKRTRLLVANGEAAQADAVKAAALSAQLRQDLLSAEYEGEAANRDLASFWTTDTSRRLELADIFEESLPSPEDHAAASGAMPYKLRPEFNLFDAQKRGLEAEAKRAKAELFPQANLAFQYGLDSNAVRAHDLGYAAFVTVNVPVFDWKRSLNASRQAQERAQQTDANRQIAERLFSRDYENATSRARTAFAQISLAAEHTKLAQEDVRLSRVRFEGGEGTALDVVTSQQALAQARIAYYASIANYLNARADQEVAAGR